MFCNPAQVVLSKKGEAVDPALDKHLQDLNAKIRKLEDKVGGLLGLRRGPGGGRSSRIDMRRWGADRTRPDAN